MRLLVTRPQPQADEWVARLRTSGIDARALPLIAIGPPADASAVHDTWHALQSHRLLMFVSPAAVEWFFKLRPADAAWPPHCLAATPGPGTARALLEAGHAVGLREAQLCVPPPDAGQFDSEHLWPVLAPLDWKGQRVTIVGGGEGQSVKGRSWLMARLQERGAIVTTLLAYERGPGTWQADDVALARDAMAEPAQHMWLFSSSQAIAYLIDHHLPRWSFAVPAWQAHHALTTHPRIAEQARRMGFGHVEEVRPTLEAVVQARRPGG